MIALLIIILVLLGLLVFAALLLGFRAGNDHLQGQIREVRREGAMASRQVGELMRDALSAIAEEAERQRRPWR